VITKKPVSQKLQHDMKTKHKYKDCSVRLTWKFC